MVEEIIGKTSCQRAKVAFGIIVECPSSKFYSFSVVPWVIE